MNFFLLSVFCLSPISPFQDVAVSIFGKVHSFPRALYERITPATPDDAFDIERLSREMPLIYRGQLVYGYLPFRHLEAYARLLGPEDVAARVHKRDHLFYVFRDAAGKVRGYSHGSVYRERNLATVDELVVEEGWRWRGVARALLGKLLEEFSRRGKTSVHVFSRNPLPNNLVQTYGAEPRPKGFDLSLVIDHLISCFSLNYLMFQDWSNPSLFADRAREIREVLRASKNMDHLKTGQAIKYLAQLIRSLGEAIQQKILERGQGNYYGIQEDKMEVANHYFLAYLISVLAKEDPSAEDNKYAHYKQIYFDFTLNEMRNAQSQGGKYPADIQIFIARQHAFARFFEEETKGTPDDKAWVKKALEEYLKLIDLRRIGERDVFVFSGHLDIALREILWFRYPYALAHRISSRLLREKENLKKIFSREHLDSEPREALALSRFQAVRQEILNEEGIALEPEFGLIFLYILPVYSEEERAVRWMIRKLFSLASFYQYDERAKNWVERPAPDLTELLERPLMHGEDSYDGEMALPTPAQIERVRQILLKLSQPLSRNQLRIREELTVEISL